MFAVSDIIVTFAYSFSLAEPTTSREQCQTCLNIAEARRRKSLQGRLNEARAEPNLFELCLARRRKATPEEEEPKAQQPKG